MLRSLGSKTIVADGTEQTLVQLFGGITSQVEGYVDLANLADGHSLTIKLYVRVRADGSWGAYHEESYSGVQALPLVYISKKPENHGLLVTLQQTAGIYKTFDYEFFTESMVRFPSP